MSKTDSSAVAENARHYYDSSDADNFYFHIWGGEDIHVGWYETPVDDIFAASLRTVHRIASKLDHWPADARVLDIGAGYGGSARVLARERGHHVTCLNLSAVQNERNRALCAEQGLDKKIEVVDGNFEDLPFDAGSFDVVWCQDSILHSGDREQVFREVDRVLRPGGEFIFTDPMQRPAVPSELLEPVLERIVLSSMGTIETYEAYAATLGWETLGIERAPQNIPLHYGRVLKELEAREEEMREHCSQDYLDRMKQGLGHWIRAGENGALDWGILHFRKPESA